MHWCFDEHGVSMSAEPMEPRPGIVAGIDLGKLREVVPRDLALRFAFGAGISIIAGLAGLLVSSRFGGMFLAFPAILPATLTLLEEKDGTEHAVHDVRGAALGAIGLIAFAVAAWGTRSLLAAAAAWLVASLSAYGAVALSQWRPGSRAARAAH